MDEKLENADPNNPSMQQILQSIRGVISGDEQLSEKENEILQLTEVVNDDGSITSLPPVTNNDVLDNIDNALGITSESLNRTSEEVSTTTDDSSTPQTNEQIDDMFNQSPKKENSDITSDNINNPKVNIAESKEVQVSSSSNNDLDVSKDLDILKATTEEVLKAKTRLISDQAAHASSEALKMLVKSVAKPMSDGLEFRSGNTLEDLIVELVKPYLSTWLDTNLPTIVKHLVEKEIQKLIPKDED